MILTFLMILDSFNYIVCG